MLPRRLKKKYVKRLVEKRVAKAIEEYEKSRANLDSAGSSGGNIGNTRGTMNVQGCSHKTFMNGKPYSFNGMKGVVGLRCWIEKVEQVFEICKCTEEDKVMFAVAARYLSVGPMEDYRICQQLNPEGWKQELWTFTMKEISPNLTLLTQKNKTYVWGDKQDEAFRILKEKLCNAPVLALPDGPDDFVVYCDASKKFWCALLMLTGQSDRRMHKTVEDA
ncbi:putative reverse transcriptase domain-containing protein [Tanacetum coccineum]